MLACSLLSALFWDKKNEGVAAGLARHRADSTRPLPIWFGFGLGFICEWRLMIFDSPLDSEVFPLVLCFPLYSKKHHLI